MSDASAGEALLFAALGKLAAAERPFQARTTFGFVRRMCDDTPWPIRALSPAISEALVEIVNRLLVKDTAGRFQTAAEVAERLEQQLAYLNDSRSSSPSGGLGGGEIMRHLSEVESG